MFWELDPDYGSSYDSVGLRVNGGMQFNEYFALEGHLGTGLAGTTKVDMDHTSSESDFSYGAKRTGAAFNGQHKRDGK